MVKPNKKFYKSKTFWVNLIGIITIISGVAPLTPEQQASILGVLNLILRAVTKEPIQW